MSFMIGRPSWRSNDGSSQEPQDAETSIGCLTTPFPRTAELGGGISPAMLANAEREYALCARRIAIFGLALSCEPAWNLLLDLFIAAAMGRERSLSAICLGTHYSRATTTRFLTLLLRAGLISRSTDGEDRETSSLHLTAHGRECMFALLDREAPG